MQNATEQERHNGPQSGVSAGTGGHYAENLPTAEQLAITHDSLCELLGIPETRWTTEVE